MSRHRSFRLSRDAYLVDRRVKPRLRLVHGVIWIFRLFLIVGGIALFWSIVKQVPEIQPAGPLGLIGAVGHLFVALLMNKAGFELGRRLAVRLDWMSTAESLSYGDRLDRWPESWLEPRPTHTTTEAPETTVASDHTAARLLESGFSLTSRERAKLLATRNKFSC